MPSPTRFFIRHGDPSVRTIQTSGSSANDGWSVISTLPGSLLDSSNHSYAFWVTLRVSNVQTFGILNGTLAGRPTGYIEIVLGDDSGSSPSAGSVHRYNIPSDFVSTTTQGQQVSFLVICSAADPDPLWGATFPGAAQLRIFGRLYWFLDDPPTYGKSWEVSDIEYVIADLGAIPAADQSSDVYEFGTAYNSGAIGPGSARNAFSSGSGGALERYHAASFGSIDERWLVFHCVYYQAEARAYPLPGTLSYLKVPHFKLGHAVRAYDGTPTGLALEQVPKVGTNNEYGNGWPWHSSTAGRDNRRRNMTRGGLWWEQLAEADRHIGFHVINFLSNAIGAPNQGGYGLPHLQGSWVTRSCYFAIRIDDLPGLIASSYSSSGGLSSGLSPPATAFQTQALTAGNFLAMEVTPPTISFEPMVFSAAIVAENIPLIAGQVGAQRSYSAHISTYADLEVHRAPNRPLLAEKPWPPTGASSSEGQIGGQEIVSSSTGIGYGDPAFAYRFRWLKPGAPTGVASLPLTDVYLVAFHPVKDPEGQGPIIPTVGADVPLVPDAEGPPVASLPDLSPQPDVGVGETFNTRTERHRGSTGYMRSWQVWYTPRRSFTLTWGPINEAARDAVLAQITGGSLFRVTLPRETVAIPAVAVAAPQVDQVSAQTWRVAVECAEIIYTR